MMRGKILDCESVEFSNGKSMYKILLNVEYEGKSILQRIFSDKPFIVGSIYELNLYGSDDLKTIKVRPSNLVDDSKKGIFNK